MTLKQAITVPFQVIGLMFGLVVAAVLILFLKINGDLD